MKPEITQEALKELLKYDEVTGEFRWRERAREHFHCSRSWNRWNNRYSESVAGGKSSDGYLRISIHNARYKSHRLAFLYHHGYMPKCIDHINHDGHDNRIENLRDVSHQVNHKNERKSKNNTSGFTGVVWRKDTSKWQAQITIDSKCVNLGSFENKEDAILARKTANIVYDFHENHGV